MLTGLGSNNDESKNSKDNQSLKKLGLFAVIVADLLGYTGAGVVLGYLAMVQLNAPWWVLLVSTLIGLVLAFYQLYKVSKKEL